MFTLDLPMVMPAKRGCNHGRIIGQKRPLLPRHVRAIRVRLELAGAIRDLALFNLMADGKLCGCDLVRLKVTNLFAAGAVKEQTSVLQSKIKSPVRFEITDDIQKAHAEWIGVGGGTVQRLKSDLRESAV